MVLPEFQGGSGSSSIPFWLCPRYWSSNVRHRCRRRRRSTTWPSASAVLVWLWAEWAHICNTSGNIYENAKTPEQTHYVFIRAWTYYWNIYTVYNYIKHEKFLLRKDIKMKRNAFHIHHLPCQLGEDYCRGSTQRQYTIIATIVVISFDVISSFPLWPYLYTAN